MCKSNSNEIRLVLLLLSLHIHTVGKQEIALDNFNLMESRKGN